MKVLFVCTGNICRSPTAERLAAAYSSGEPVENLSFSSAGTRAVIGHPIHPEAARVIEDLGGHAGGFAARQLTPRLAADADLLITMTRTHRDAVLQAAPQKLHCTFTLTEVATLVSEHGARRVDQLPSLRPYLRSETLPGITDPIGGTPEIFTRVGTQIAELVPQVIRLCRA